MIYVKINNTLYPAIIEGRVADSTWDNRFSKAITLEMDYSTAASLFMNGTTWSTVEISEEPTYDENWVQIDTKINEIEYDNSAFTIAGDITDHRDGTITVKMGKLTALEEAYEIMFGGN